MANMPARPARETGAGAVAAVAEPSRHQAKSLQRLQHAQQARLRYACRKSATSHYIGSGFPSAYGIRYQSGENELRPIHATSWGLSTRIIGAVVMVHADDAGLVLPPLVAPIQAVVLTIQDAKTAKCQGYNDAARTLVERLLGAGIRCEGDFTGDRLGQKQFKWEKFGVSVRIVFGLNEMTNGAITLIRRDTNARITLLADNIADSLGKLLAEIQADMYAKAKARLTHNTVVVRTLDQVREMTEDCNVFFAGGWCGDPIKEAELKESLGLTIRCIPLHALSSEATCFMTGRRAVQQVVVGKAY
jgi:prolyl-tRNA synthetase